MLCWDSHPEKVLRDLEDARCEAMLAGQWGPAIRASELQGKHIAMFVERREINVEERSVIRAPEPLSPEEWEAKYGRGAD